MSAIVEFFRPTLYKLIFTLEWVAYLLLTLVERHPLDPDLLPVAACLALLRCRLRPSRVEPAHRQGSE